MNQKELEEEQRLIAVKQIRQGELKAKQKMYASSTTFGRQLVSQYTLKFAEFLKNKIETTIKYLMSEVAKLRSEYNNSLHFLQLPLTFPLSSI